MAILQVFVSSLLLGLTLSQTIGDTPWDTVNTTFPYFYGVPLTASDAISKGWKIIKSCDDTTYTPGNVYVSSDDDLTSMPIYNADGNIAGVIVGIDDPGETQHGRAPWMQYTPSSQSNTSYTTFYGIEGIFRDPTTICTSGSTNSITFGDRLWFTNGTFTNGTIRSNKENGIEYNKIPLNESYCGLYSKGWYQGGCKDDYFKMGVHYWRWSSPDVNCNYAYPIFLLYNNNTLHAWGIAMGNTDRPYPNSSRWEHPPGSFLDSFFLPGETPTCLTTQNDTIFNSIHIYMTSSVLENTAACSNTSTINHQTNCPGYDNDITTTQVITTTINNNNNGEQINTTTIGSSTDTNSTDTTAAIVIGIVGAFALIIIIIVGARWYGKNREHQADGYAKFEQNNEL